MRVALISDIHANLPALNAVLNHIQNQEVNAIWNAGDNVGYGPYPDQVVRTLRDQQILNVKGSFDSRALQFPRKRAKWREKKRPETFLAIYWANENLSQPAKEYLGNLPVEVRMRIGSKRILLTHGSALVKKEIIYVKTPEKDLVDILERSKSQILIMGGFHHPFFKEVKNSLIVNPGSVGRQSDGDPRASYAILEFNPELMLIDHKSSLNMKVQHFRIEYDIAAAVNEVRRRGLPEAYAQTLIQGMELQHVLEKPEVWQVPELEDQSWYQAPFKDQNRQEFEEEKFSKVVELTEKHSPDLKHIEQTTFLAMRLFDELQPLHRLNPDQRFWLRCGAYLHDIGKGNKKHHLKALNMILKTKVLDFSPRERNIIGSIARYHRREDPNDKHENLTGLPVVDQRVVTILSSILRVADGLDSSPRSNVMDLVCVFSTAEITIKCKVKEQAEKHKKRALGKGELMEFAFDRDLYIEWHRI